MDSDKVADLYYQKAESFHGSMTSAWMGNVIAIAMGLTTTVFGSSFILIVGDPGHTVPALAAIIAVILLVFVQNYRHMRRYGRMRTAYLQFYAVRYIMEYCGRKGTTEPDADDLEEIADRMHRETMFDRASLGRSVPASYRRNFEHGCIMLEP